MQVLFRTALMAGLAALSWPLLADEAKTQTETGKGQSQTSRADADKDQQQDSRKNESRDGESTAGSKRAYLGIGVGPVPAALASHFREQVPVGQGLFVEDVADKSPAEKFGIKEDDILLSFDDQKLFSPEQLAKLVRVDKPGREATLEVLRNGNRKKIQVTLGERPNDDQRNRQADRNDQNWAGRRFSRRPASSEAAWEDFDSLSLKKVDKDKYRAEVQYLDKENKIRKHVFEGTRDEIRKDIQAQKDLKPEERDQLMRSFGLVISDQFPFGRFPGGNAGSEDRED